MGFFLINVFNLSCFFSNRRPRYLVWFSQHAFFDRARSWVWRCAILRSCYHPRVPCRQAAHMPRGLESVSGWREFVDLVEKPFRQTKCWKGCFEHYWFFEIETNTCKTDYVLALFGRYAQGVSMWATWHISCRSCWPAAPNSAMQVVMLIVLVYRCSWCIGTDRIKSVRYFSP